MPTFIVPTLMRIALGAFGAAAVAFWAVREARRVNAELDRAKAAKTVDPRREPLPTLRRDPSSGQWRVM
jgi:hypothetical protein